MTCVCLFIHNGTEYCSKQNLREKLVFVKFVRPTWVNCLHINTDTFLLQVFFMTVGPRDAGMIFMPSPFFSPRF